jgi:hypothetical protein
MSQAKKHILKTMGKYLSVHQQWHVYVKYNHTLKVMTWFVETVTCLFHSSLRSLSGSSVLLPEHSQRKTGFKTEGRPGTCGSRLAIISGARDQEDHGSKPACAISSQDSVSKKPFTKIGLVEWLEGVGPEFKPQYRKKRKKEKKRLKSVNLVEWRKSEGRVAVLFAKSHLNP